MAGLTQAHPPITVSVTCQGKAAVAVVDQIRAVAKHRLRSKIERASPADLHAVAEAVSLILDLGQSE
ncbi:MAG: type II toxin-antitoxin system PemK/MazF family toxin [SAR324 cluster bacterium]|nr:type II toxin-antitoxin system PemK/MazF family toxin [SAR324 cluster bacterium]